MGTGECNAGDGKPAIDQDPIQGGAEILQVVSRYSNRNTLRPHGPLGLNADFTYICLYQHHCSNTKQSDHLLE